MLDDDDERIGATRVDRLIRNGWLKTRDGFTKPSFRGWTLVKHLKRTFSEAHELVAVDGRVEEHYDWQWAEYDEARDRIVFASGGCIYALPSLRHKPKLLFDANGMTFEAIAAPYNNRRRRPRDESRRPLRVDSEPRRRGCASFHSAPTR